MRSSLKIIDEEEKEFNEAFDEVKNHNFNYANIQSEQIYDNQNQLINEISMESVRSNSNNFREDNLRNTKGLSLLERANRAFERESENSNNSAPMAENQSPEQQFDVIEEVISESLNHSVVQNAVMSSDHSLAPPGEELEEEHEVV